MQILILSIPSGETVNALSYIIDAETVIGQGSACQIPLPDRQNMIAERHARIFPEDDQWYLENLSSGELRINTTAMPPHQGKRHLLSDGDMIYCADYCLMASDFSPWQEKPVATLSVQEAMVETDSEDYCPIPSAGGAPSTEHLNDPFLRHEIQQQVLPLSDGSQDESKQQAEALFSDFMVEIDDSAMGTSQPDPLIDVLARDDEVEEDDWSINRNLRLSPVSQAKEQAATDSPVTKAVHPEPEHQGERFQGEDWRPADLLHQQVVIDAILEALELMLADFSPDNLEQLLSPVDHAQQPSSESGAPSGAPSGVPASPGKGWQGSSRASGPDYWQHYQSFYRCLMHGKHYRELFLQRLSNALNR